MAIKFRGVDFLEFDSLLTDDERLVRDTTRKFIEDNLIPIIEECNRAGRFPRELVKPMAELGLYGASLTGYGCAGMSNVEYGLVMQELERGDSGVRSFVSVHSSLVMYPIYTFGSEEQKQFWLPLMQKGEKLGCFGLTEPDSGSNPGSMRTRARKSGKEYVLNGEKMWITSGSIADVAVIWAKVEGEADQVRGFLVEADRPGFKAEDIHGKWSLRASVTSG
ncbi:MAG: acyl-CoA dehydrogenase family protein, partial [Terriglobales bacterium]